MEAIKKRKQREEEQARLEEKRRKQREILNSRSPIEAKNIALMLNQ